MYNNLLILFVLMAERVGFEERYNQMLLTGKRKAYPIENHSISIYPL